MSSFLTLPREIRDNIYHLVFQRRTVHVQTDPEWPSMRHQKHTEGHGDGRVEWVPSHDLVFYRCSESLDETQAFEKFLLIRSDNPLGLRDECKGPCIGCIYCKRHIRTCWGMNKNNLFKWDERDESLLLVSRSVRVEAMEIFYGLTAFSIGSLQTLKALFSEKLPLRRRLLGAMHLDIYDLSAVRFQYKEQWTREGDFISGMMGQLTGLRTLHISIRPSWWYERYEEAQFSPWPESSPPAELDQVEQPPTGDPRHYTKMGNYELVSGQLHEGTLSWWQDVLMPFRHPMLQHVTIFIEDAEAIQPYDGIDRIGWKEERRKNQYGNWTTAQKTEFTRLLKEKLTSK